jgi:hypothetical protein
MSESQQSKADEIWTKYVRYNNDGIAIFAYPEALQAIREHERKLAEERIVLQAWQSAFGTTQLTHAKARLEVAVEFVKSIARTDRNLASDKAKELLRNIGGPL